MSNVVKLSDRKKAQEQAAKKAAAQQKANQAGGRPSAAKIALLVLSMAIVALGIFWEPVIGFLANLLGR